MPAIGMLLVNCINLPLMFVWGLFCVNKRQVTIYRGEVVEGKSAMLISPLMIIGAFSLFLLIIVLLVCIAIVMRKLRKPPMIAPLKKPEPGMVYRRAGTDDFSTGVRFPESVSRDERSAGSKPSFEPRKAADTRPLASMEDKPPDIVIEAAQAPPTPSPLAILKVLQGISLKNEYPIYEDNFIIGRAKDVNLVLNDERVSRRHAVIRFVNHQWYIQDKESVNGILVNGERVKATRLKSGDEITIATYVFRFQILQ